MLTEGRIWGRRLAMPLVAVLIAAGIMMWSSWRAPSRQGTAQQLLDVQQLADGLCADLRAGRDPAPRLAGTDALIASRLVPRLTEVMQRAGGGADRMRVVSSAGDWPGAGSTGGQATHTAIVHVDGHEALGLRFLHQGPARPVAIIGFWTPP